MSTDSALVLLELVASHVAGAAADLREGLPDVAARARVALALEQLFNVRALLEPRPYRPRYTDGRMFFQGRPPCGWVLR